MLLCQKKYLQTIYILGHLLFLSSWVSWTQIPNVIKYNVSKKGPMKLSCLWDPKAFSAHEFFYRKMYTVSIQKWWKTANFYCSKKTFCSLLIVWFLIFPLNQVNVNQSLPKNWDLTHRLLCDKVFIYWFEYISAFKRLDIKVKI